MQSILRLRMLGAVCAVLLCSSALNAKSLFSKSFVITSKGEPKAEIVVPDQAEPPVAFAAQELQRYVKLMSGADLRIVHASSDEPAIVLTIHPLNSSNPCDEDHYSLKIEKKCLQIEGASPRAVLYGVYDVLERLGCGWCVPGDDTVPQRKTLELENFSVDARPAFEYRMMLDFPLMSTEQSLAICDWIIKNRMNWVRACANAHGEPTAWFDRRDRVLPELKKRNLRVDFGGHTMHTWINEKQFDAHSEWFALINGKRKAPTLCITNPEMTAELIKNMQKFLDRCPETDVIDLWHTDSDEYCHCSKCTRGVLSDEHPTSMPVDSYQASFVITYVEFVNKVAAAIAQSHPKVMLGPLIYSQTDRAMPDAAPQVADNVLLGVAHFYRDSYMPLIGEPKSALNRRFLGNDLTWIAKTKHFYIYEYYNCWISPYIYPGAQIIARDIETFQQLEIQGVSSDMYGYSPINMYVAARAFWKPNLSWEATVRDFCRLYYGDVGEEMADNEIRLEKGIYGKNGYQCNGARGEIEKWPDMPAAGLYLQQQRPGQITFLKAMIEKTKDSLVKTRLERQLKPWSLWNEEPRFWAYPDFPASK